MMPITKRVTAWWRHTILICAAVGFFGLIARAQSERGKLTFEAASVKPAPPGPLKVIPVTGGPGTKDPTLFTARKITLLSLVMRAFDVKFRYQCAWLPWMEIEQYNVQARIQPGTTEEQFRVMLQNLLAERFALKVHHRTNDMSGYRLVVAKAGPKFTPSEPPAVESDHFDQPDNTKVGLDRLPAGVVRGRNGIPELGPGDSPHDLVTRAGHFLRVRREGMERLAFRLSRELQQPVIDATGLKGEYDFTLIWAPDRPINRPAESAGSEPQALPLFEALQRQLGLRLEPVKRQIPVDVLVVDYARKTPNEN